MTPEQQQVAASLLHYAQCVARRIGKGDDEIESIAVLAMVKAVLSYPPDCKVALKTHVYSKITRDVFAEVYRRKRVAQTNRYLEMETAKSIRHLPEPFAGHSEPGRTLALLRYRDGYSARDIAKRTGISNRKVKRILREFVSELRNEKGRCNIPTGFNLAAKLSASSSGFAGGLAEATRALIETGASADTVAKMVQGAGSRMQGSVNATAKASNNLSATLADGASKTAKANEKSSGSWDVLKIAAGIKLAKTLDAAQDKFVLGVYSQIAGTIQLADSFGVSTEAIVAFTKQAKLLNIEASVVESGLSALNRELGAVQFGSKEASLAFEKLGLNGKELAALPLDKAFLRVADSIGRITDPTKKAAMILGIFGDKSAAITPLLQSGSKGVRRSRKES